MRILHVLDHSVPMHSGYSFRTLAILREQRRLGWDTAHVTSAKHTAARAPVEESDGLRFYRTLSSHGVAERLPVVDQAVIVHGLRRRLADVIAEVKPDLLHAHSPSLNGLAALWASRSTRLPVVYEVRALWEDGAVDHGTAAAGGWRYRASRALETRVLRSVQAVTTICHGLRRELVSRGIPDAKVTVIPNAVDSTRFTLAGAPDPALAQRWGLAGTRVIGFIGSFYGYEGLSLLLDATPALLARRGDLRVLLVGGGDQEDALRRQARERGIADRVLFAGRVPHDEIQEYYNLIDVLVYPRWSTRVTELVTPLKPLEAMAQGRLVVASDVGGHRELIQEGTALLFRAGDAASLAETVLAALESPERTAAMRAAGRRFVETERTWERSVSRYIDVYHDALNGRRRGGP